MSESLCYKFEPCCGGHPIYVTLQDQNGDVVVFPFGDGKVYQYTPLAGLPYNGGPVSNNESLIPGQCYRLDEVKLNDVYIAQLNPCPEYFAEGNNWTDTPNETCLQAKEDPQCACATVYELIPCCEDQTTLIYNVTGLSTPNELDQNTYITTINPIDYTATQCYTYNLLTNYQGDTTLLPILDIADIDVSPITCASPGCFLLCQPCECYSFSGTTGIYNVITCDIKVAEIKGTIDGPVITYNGDPTEFPVTQICLRAAVEDTPGLTVTTNGECETVYWDQTGSQFDCPVNYKIVSCDPNLTEEYCVTNDLSIYFNTGQIFTLIVNPGDTPKCWYVDIADTCVNPITITAPSLTFYNCNDCLQTFITVYKLTNCEETFQSIYTDVDLSDYLGSLIKLENYTGCWYVEVHTGLNPQLITVSVLPGMYETCPDCNLQSYLLEDCAGIEDDIVTNTDLSAYVGSVITLETCPDICWQVSETELSSLGPVYFKEEFVDCTACLISTQPAICVTFTNTSEFSTSFNYTDSLGDVNKTTMYGKQVIPKVCALSWDINPSVSVTEYGNCVDGVCPPTPSPKRKVTPGYNTPACTVEYYENVECNFSEWMYKDVLEKRYGITNCCPEELMKWEIKHEMLMLDALVNPDYICQPSSSCCEPIVNTCGSCGCQSSNCNC